MINSSGKLQASVISNLDTDNLSEGSTNLYFTTSRVDTHLANASVQKLSQMYRLMEEQFNVK